MKLEHKMKLNRNKITKRVHSRKYNTNYMMMKIKCTENKFSLTIIDISDAYSLLMMSRDTVLSINCRSFITSSCECEPAENLHHITFTLNRKKIASQNYYTYLN